MAYCGEMGPKSARVTEYFEGKREVDWRYNPVSFYSRCLYFVDLFSSFL